MKEESKDLLIAILKSNLSPQFKEEILREMFLPKIGFKDFTTKESGSWLGDKKE